MPPCVRLLTSWYSPREIGRAWGIWNASHQIGGAVIAVWAGWLVSHYGWRSAFWVPALVCVKILFSFSFMVFLVLVFGWKGWCLRGR